MADSEQSDIRERVETRAVIGEDSQDIQVRVNGTEGIWLKPEKLDGDGELHLTLAYLGRALEVLGFNAADVFTEG
jgi:hypothetical protein